MRVNAAAILADWYGNFYCRYSLRIVFSAFGVILKSLEKPFSILWDYLISAVIMPIGALSVAVFTAWIQDRESVLANAGAGSSVPQTIIRLWLMVLRYVAPLAIVVVFVNSLGLI